MTTRVVQVPSFENPGGFVFGDAIFYVSDVRVFQEESIELSGASIAIGFRLYYLTSHPPEVLIYPSIGFALGVLARQYVRSNVNA